MLPCVRKLNIYSEGEGCVSGQLGVLVYVDPKFDVESNDDVIVGTVFIFEG